MINALPHIILRYRHLVAVVAWCVAALACPAAAWSQVFFNGNPAIVDDDMGLVLYTVPRDMAGKDFTATVQVDPHLGWTNITVAGKKLYNNPITFASVQGGKVYLLRAMRDGRPITRRIMFSHLPLVQLSGDIGYDYTAATMSLLEPDGTMERDMTALVRWRGGSTNAPDKHKRNYSIKFVDSQGEKQNRKLLGMRRDNHWIMDAGQGDPARIRNRVATDLWLDMAAEPYHYNMEPDALTGARGTMVEVAVNGRYMGVYALGENVDRKQLQLKKFDDSSSPIHGQLWQSKNWTAFTAFKRPMSFDNKVASFGGIDLKYPELEDVAPTDYSPLYNACNFVAYNSIDGFNESVHKYFDLPPIIDYIIFIQVLTAIDNEANNLFWFIYDKQEDRKMSIAVWDLDWTVGMDRNSPTLKGGPRSLPTYDMECSNYLFYRFFDRRCIYNRMLLDRYRELRATWLSEQSLTERYSNAINQLLDCGAAAREEERWSGDTDINGIELDLAAERDFIVKWIGERLAFLDRATMRHPTDINADGITNVADVSKLHNILTGDAAPTATADVNGDGVVNAADYTALFNYIMLSK